jgi:hypothetical protein
MTQAPPDDFVWPTPWEPILGEVACLEYPKLVAEAFGEEWPACSLASELQREVGPAHPLYQISCSAIARNCQDPNEFLFFTTHPAMPLAFVHLTWKKEELPNFPWVEGYESWDAFKKAWIE